MEPLHFVSPQSLLLEKTPSPCLQIMRMKTNIVVPNQNRWADEHDTADELFCEGKLFPLWQMQRSDHYEFNKIALKTENLEEKGSEKTEQINEEASRISWFLDDDASPTPPTCTVLWKELLRLRKQRASTLSPPSSSLSGSSKTETSAADGGEEIGKKNKKKVVVKRIEIAMERTRWASSTRRRPVFNLAVCIGRKNNVSPLFSAGNGNLES